MINPINDLSTYHNDTTDETTEKFLKNHFMILLQMSKDKGELTLEQYDELIFEPVQTLEQQGQAYNKLIYNLLLNRIIKGAEYIESITPDHPKYQLANEKYNKYLKQLE